MISADSRFDISDAPLAGLKLVERRRVGDERGFFSRLYCGDSLGGAGFVGPIVQINHTVTGTKGTIRGMHYQQPPAAEDKFVSCLRGEILDVAIDIRTGSPTYMRWHGEILSAENCRSLFIPKGFAHGFQTLTADCELIYMHTAPYAPASERAINALDPRLAITWPLPVSYMSAKDRAHPFLDDGAPG